MQRNDIKLQRTNRRARTHRRKWKWMDASHKTKPMVVLMTTTTQLFNDHGHIKASYTKKDRVGHFLPLFQLRWIALWWQNNASNCNCWCKIFRCSKCYNLQLLQRFYLCISLIPESWVIVWTGAHESKTKTKKNKIKIKMHIFLLLLWTHWYILCLLNYWHFMCSCLG